MRRPVAFILVGLVVALFGTSCLLFQLYRRSEQSGRNAAAREATERANYARAAAAVGEIRDSLRAAAGSRSILEPDSESPAPRGRTVEERRSEALASIARLDTHIRLNQAKIAKLEAAASSGGAQAAERARSIAMLRRTVTREQQRVAELMALVQGTTSRVAALESEVLQNAETIRVRELIIEAKRHELAAIYYVIGTKRKLIADGVVSAQGGHLGLGRRLHVTGHPNERLFKSLDTDRDRIIRVPSRKAEVLSAQDPASYFWRLGNGDMTLEIISPQQFLKVKYLVIMTE